MNNLYLINQKAWDEPRVGDYWHEMYCPYFLVVDIQGDAYTVLCTVNNSVAQNAKVNGRDYWHFDYSKHSVVTKDWIQKMVKYEYIDDFVANVLGNEKMMNIVNKWREANPDYIPVIQRTRSRSEDIWFLGI